MSLEKKIQILMSYMDDETFHHCSNVKNTAVLMGVRLGMDKELIGNACAILDIGKLLINKDVFHKAEPLSEVERELMNLHSYLGYRICIQNEVPENISQIILYHHGEDVVTLSDVPQITDEIRKYVELIHTVDVYEALREERGYRKKHSRSEAYEIMQENKNEFNNAVLKLLYEMEL